MDDTQKANGSRAYGTFQPPEAGSPENQASLTESSVAVKVPFLRIEREAMTQVTLHRISPPFKSTNTFPEKVQTAFKNHISFSCECVGNFFKRTFPVLAWLPKYDIRNDFLIDFITGITLLILHVPQGMAYAQLASVAPIYGLYTSFYPVLIYFFMGTSRHLSFGTFAISSLLTGSEVEGVVHQEYLMYKASLDHINLVNHTTLTPNASLPLPYITPSGIILHSQIQIAMIICLTVGFLQGAMGILRMGSLTAFMSDEMVSAFISGTVVHVFTSQLKPLTGATIPKHSGPFNIIMTWISLFKCIGTINYIVFLTSICSLVFLVFIKEIINGILLARVKVPVPAELLLVICGTLISKYLDLHKLYHVDIVGPTPTGLMEPQVPPVQLVPTVLTSSLILAVVCATTTLSMVIIYAKKHEYEIDTNQELISYGVAGIVSSFFFCIPSCGSLSRSAIQESTGAKSQIAGLVSCIFMLVVLLALGPLFEPLPSCILSAVIVVSLKSMLLHFGDLQRAWNVSKLDASVWAVTFLSVVILDMDYGLIIGILFSLITILFRSQYPDTCLLGQLPGTELYRSIDKYPNVQEIPGVKIFHFGVSIYFGNREYFRTQIFNLTSKHEKLPGEKDLMIYKNSKNDKPKLIGSNEQLTFSTSFKKDDLLKLVIIDLSAVGYMDSGGVATLVQVIKEFALNDIDVYLASAQEHVLENLENQGFFKTFSEENIFPTIHDAVLFAKSKLATS